MTATNLRADAQYSQLEVVPSSHDTGNVFAVANPKLSDDKGVEEANASARRPFWHRKWIWVTLLVIVIGAVVAGAVGGSSPNVNAKIGENQIFTITHRPVTCSNG